MAVEPTVCEQNMEIGYGCFDCPGGVGSSSISSKAAATEFGIGDGASPRHVCGLSLCCSGAPTVAKFVVVNICGGSVHDRIVNSGNTASSRDSMLCIKPRSKDDR